MTEFTPISGVVGGVLIGVAAVWLLWANGRIAGVSGILGSLLTRRPEGLGWRLCFIVGLILSPMVCRTVVGDLGVELQAPWLLMVVAGFIVGFGTRIGSGCTSGHGVCGIARISPRSLVATGVFLITAIVTVFLSR